MRKLKFFLAAFLCCLTGLLALPCGIGGAHAAETEYYIGGMTAGFSLSAGGTEIIALNEVVAEDGVHRPAEDAGIRTGDTIRAVDGVRVKSIADLNAALERSGGRAVKLTVRRGGEDAEVEIVPVRDKKSGKYKIGVLIRDTLSGIGTVTYIEKGTRRFGALGHDVCDENRNPLEISDAQVFLCSVVGVSKGSRGKAGELRGLVMNDEPIARAEKVCKTGLFGTFEEGYDFSKLQTVKAAPLEEATIGRAEIWSTVDGIAPQRYTVDLVKVDANNRENKNFVIKVTDGRLIEETGGIVQGMSGSPILQNGKLVGAVTHVFLNDPTRGYGIGVEKMLGN